MLGLMLLTSNGAAGVALIVGIDRFMSEARALTSTMSNAVACVVVSIWERACDREVLQRELTQGYAATEEALEDEATMPLPGAIVPGVSNSGGPLPT